MRKKRPNNTMIEIKKYRVFYMMLIPIVLYFIIFSFYPLYLGIVSSFMETKLIGKPTFAMLDNYKTVLHSQLYGKALLNTLFVGCGTFVMQFLLGLTLALCLHEVTNKKFKSAVQSVTYLPNLLSWAIVGSMWVKILSPSGMVNGFLRIINGAGFKPIVFMSEDSLARGIMIFTGAWKGSGYFAVLLLAAIVSIDLSIYEAASIDGASRLKQIFSITVPNIVPTMKVIAVLASMNVLRNFDQIFVMQNPMILNSIRNLLYLIYYDGLIKFKIGLATSAATMVLIATLCLSFAIRKLIRYDQNYE